MDAALTKELRRYITDLVRAGFDEPNEIALRIPSVFCDDGAAETLLEAANRILEEELSSHLREQFNWPAVTDCDRLDAMFGDLESVGIMSRQNFSCCGNCGHGEILELLRINGQNRHVLGYTFFHMQETWSAIAGQGLYLSCAAVDGEPADSIKVGHQVVDAAIARGLAANWNGALSNQIQIEMTWKRRRRSDGGVIASVTGTPTVR